CKGGNWRLKPPPQTSPASGGGRKSGSPVQSVPSPASGGGTGWGFQGGMGMNADYVIVGAGSAGCPLANRLTADPSVKVILLEAGGKDTSPLIHIPAGYIKLLDHK